MQRQERAKQFLPFDAMKGLKEAIEAREQERLRVCRRSMSEEFTEQLSDTLAQLTVDDAVRIGYFESGKEYTLIASVKKMGEKSLTICDDNRIVDIPFSDIFFLEIL